MAEMIKCPSCGESNRSDQEFCQYCRTRLQPLTSSTKGTDAPIKPGQFPTKKNTAELEPILPQWLRDARDSARKSAEDDAALAAKQPQSTPVSSTPDLLAGLHSQADSDEDETPDWLASITGNAPKSKKAQAESADVRWVELGDAKDFAKDEAAQASETPPWLTGINASHPKDEKDETSDWLPPGGGISTPPQTAKPGPFDASLSNDDSSDWLKQMAASSMQDDDPIFNDPKVSFKTAPTDDTPDWLRHMGAQDDDANKNKASINTGAAPAFDSLAPDTPDWLKSESKSAPSNAGSSAVDTPDWLRGMGGEQEDQARGADPFNLPGASTGGSGAPAGFSSTEDVPDWLQGMPAVESNQSMQGPVPTWLKEESATPADEDVPSWLSNKPAQPEPAASEQVKFSMDDRVPLDDDIPSWLQGAGPRSSEFEMPPSEGTESPASSSSDSPDWLNSFRSEGAPPPAAFSMQEPIESTPGAFTINPLNGNEKNSDALFTDMPDWLSNVSEAAPNRTSVTGSDAIAPSDLPSWVQAMRPMDSGASRSSSSSSSSDQTLESRGALSGLQGVLPSMPGYAPTSKPKAYSIKLQASDEQQSHAALLEQILAAETEPVPIASFSALRTSRSLRWALSAILLTVLTIVLFSGIQIFTLPNALPNEIANARQVAQSIPEGAPVLVAFDYQPARVGEMEAIAAPIFSMMRSPSLTFISTNETGALLAERLISGPLAGINNESPISYLNAGYLPGGQMGIRAFSQNPSAAMPQLSGFTSFSQFVAFFIITDNADDARTWIEQTASTRGTIPIVVISSAQAAPMIQPYIESQQLNGLVSGLYGSAVLESNNSGGLGTARTYWDSFSTGMLLAMAFILGGGLLNMALGMRDRAAAREEK